MNKQEITLRIVGPQTYYTREGAIEHKDAYGIVSTDGVETWDVAYPFSTSEEAENMIVTMTEWMS